MSKNSIIDSQVENRFVFFNKPDIAEKLLGIYGPVKLNADNTINYFSDNTKRKK